MKATAWVTAWVVAMMSVANAQDPYRWTTELDLKAMAKRRPAELFRTQVGYSRALNRNAFAWRWMKGSAPYVYTYMLAGGLPLLKEGKVAEAAIWSGLAATTLGATAGLSEMFLHPGIKGDTFGKWTKPLQRIRGNYLPLIAPTLALRLIDIDSKVFQWVDVRNTAVATLGVGIAADVLLDNTILRAIKPANLGALKFYGFTKVAATLIGAYALERATGGPGWATRRQRAVPANR